MRSLTFRRLGLIFLLLTAACDSLPIPQLTFATRTPAPPPGPTLTPVPSGLVNFRVHAPANTPPEAVLAAQILEPISGRQTVVPLTRGSDGAWQGGAPATLGRVLRYRYILTAPSGATEATVAGQPVVFRLAVVSDANGLVQDQIAAWSGLPFRGEPGALSGAVRNANTGHGVAGVIVSAGGQLALTASDGGYTLYNVPAGAQRVTAMAPDGSLRPVQVTVTVPAGQTATADLSAADPNAVHLTFVVRLPAGADAAAGQLRLVGEGAPLGDVFLPGPAGSSVRAARAPALMPVGDGRLAVIVPAYEGTVLRYAYSLGDGYWNGELDGAGARRLREYVVPPTDAIIEDTVLQWHAGSEAPVTFEVTAPADTPADTVVTLQFRTTAWLPPLPLARAGGNLWRFVLNSPEDFTGEVHYRYCRNFACGAADEAGGALPLDRAFTPTLLPQVRKDTIAGWQWQTTAPPPAVILPPAGPHPGFAGGVSLTEAWSPDALPVTGGMLRGLPAAAFNTVTILRRSQLTQAVPPVLADDLALSLPAAEFHTLVDEAHAAGLSVTLHPVTCAYTPYGACDYWASAPFSPEYWAAWFAAYERHLLTQADLAAQSGAEALVVGDYKLRPAFPGEPEAPPDADARWRALLAKVRAHFGGRLAFELLLGQSVWPNPPAFLESVDQIYMAWWAALPGDPAAQAAKAGVILDQQVLPVAQRFGQPLYLNAAYLSAQGAAGQCLPQPDGQCHPFWDFNPEAPNVTPYGVDLGEQAGAYNALLAAVYPRTWVMGVSAAGYNPQVALRDKSLSVRGKPAEMVLTAWLLRFQGR